MVSKFTHFRRAGLGARDAEVMKREKSKAHPRAGNSSRPMFVGEVRQKEEQSRLAADQKAVCSCCCPSVSGLRWFQFQAAKKSMFSSRDPLSRSPLSTRQRGRRSASHSVEIGGRGRLAFAIASGMEEQQLNNHFSAAFRCF